MLEKLQRALGLKTNPAIFFTSAALTFAFVAVSVVFTDGVDRAFRSGSDAIKANLGWFYILGVTSFLIFLIWIAASRYGNVRLGGKEARPEYNNVT
jgi:choline/glycine/proline betaine transport protein